jgi:hypothetical protein
MGRRVRPIPVSEARYRAGLAEGRDLYAEDLARLAQRTRNARVLLGSLLIATLVFALAIGGMLAWSALTQGGG